MFSLEIHTRAGRARSWRPSKLEQQLSCAGWARVTYSIIRTLLGDNVILLGVDMLLLHRSRPELGGREPGDEEACEMHAGRLVTAAETARAAGVNKVYIN